MSWVTMTTVFAELGLEPQELVLQPDPHHRVDRAERLVHQQHRRVRGQRPGHADPLLLAAGELVRVAVAVRRRVEADQVEQLVGPLPGDRLRLAVEQRHGHHVGDDLLVREQPDLLDDVADPAAQLTGSERVTSSPSISMVPVVGSISRLIIFSVVDLPHPDGPTRTTSSPARDVEVELLDGDGAVVVGLADPGEADHGVSGSPHR